MNQKLAILQEIDRSRTAIKRDLSNLKDEMNLAKKFEKIVRKKPAWWLAGAGLTGFVIASLRMGTKKPAPSRKAKKGGKDSGPIPKEAPVALTFWGFVFAVIKIVFPLFKPVITALATRRMTDLAFSLAKK